MNEFDSAAMAFVAVCFERLRAEGAIPTSTSHRHLQAGLDFELLPIKTLPEYARLEEAIIDATPNISRADGAGSAALILLTSLLEWCVRTCSSAGSYDPNGPEVSAAVVQLAQVVSEQPYEIVLARHVSHLVSTSAAEIEIDGITLVPEGRASDISLRILKEIPDADHAWKRYMKKPYRPPHALLIVRKQVCGLEYFGDSDLAQRLDQFQLGVCLLTGANVQGSYQVFGPNRKIAAQSASLKMLARDTDITTTRRTARLDGTEGPAIAALVSLVEEARSKTGGEGIWLSSFREALDRFAEFDDTTPYTEQLVSLATSLEGVMLGTNEGEGLTLRLYTRVTALLANDDDPAGELFEDLKQLYNLRSNIVHGGEVLESTLNKNLKTIKCVPAIEQEENTLIRLGYAVDRLRDIVRRSILARTCLASGKEPPWPFKEKGKPSKVKVDAELSDDATRAIWRTYWREMLDSLGVGEAAARSRPPVFSLTSQDR
ncbi:hypothetical protein [Nocardia sp. NPDC057030]|uniref:hypothetical protein n=1 Tax=unclassified Nocardia TaxID=2637762 RepID=UPI0036415026